MPSGILHGLCKQVLGPTGISGAFAAVFRCSKARELTANIAIEIPDDVARQLTAAGDEISRAVLEAVTVEAYRTGKITSAQVQQMLGLSSRWETDALLRRAEANIDYSVEDLERDIAAIRDSRRQ